VNDVRPFFGEFPDVIGSGRIPWNAEPIESREFGWEGVRDRYIADGCCPMVGCHRELVEGGCPGCGWSVLEEKLRERTPADEPDYLPTLPSVLFVDEYAPASLDDAA